MTTEYGWFNLYEAAVLETDWSKIEERIQVTENGIKARLNEFTVHHSGTSEEIQAIEHALNALKVLRKEVAAGRDRNRRASWHQPSLFSFPAELLI